MMPGMHMGNRGISLPIILVVIVALLAGGAAIFVLLPTGGEESGTESNSRESDPAISTLAACQAGCRDQYGGSGSAGFDACIRGCGAGGAAGARVFPETNNPTPSSAGATPAGVGAAPQPAPRTPPPASPPVSGTTPIPAASAPQPKTVHVTIEGFAFSPRSVKAKVGDTIIFTNKDTVGHTATQSGGGFDTGLIVSGESKSITLSAAGTLNYFCVPHPNMTGTIAVE